MLTASPTLMAAMADGRALLPTVRCTLRDGSTMVLTAQDIQMGGLTYEKAVSGDSSFDIGAFIVGKLVMTICNVDGAFDPDDFDDAVMRLEIGAAGAGSDAVSIGVYHVVDHTTDGAWITLTCYDNGALFSVPLSDVGLTFPMTAAAMVSAICNYVGVSHAALPASLGAVSIAGIPDGWAPNCLQAVAWAAQMGGASAWVNSAGYLAIGWTDTATLATLWGNIEDDGWDEADLTGAAELTAISSVRTATDDVVVTGVSLSYDDENGGVITLPLAGADGYVIQVEGNPLVDSANAAGVLANLAAALVGMRFRPFSVTMLGNPLLEPGDIVSFEDARGRHFLSVITTLRFTLGGYMTAGCGAEAPVKQAASNYTPTTRAIQRTGTVAKRAARLAGDTAQHVWVTETGTDTGVHVTEITQEEFVADPENGGGNLLARSNGVAVRDGLTELATFSADGVQIGREGDARLSLQATKMAMTLLDLFSAFVVESSATSTYTATENMTYDGGDYPSISYDYPLFAEVTDEELTINGSPAPDGFVLSATSSTDGWMAHRTYVLRAAYLTVGDVVTATYTVTGPSAHVTLGHRTSRGAIGPWSFTAGIGQAAGGAMAAALGELCSASGRASLAAGSHATAAGDFSVALGRVTTAAEDDQTVVGRHNAADADAAFIVGNGRPGAPSNALRVGWDGSIDTAKGAIAPPTIFTVTGSTVSLASGTPATIASVRLRKGAYILTGCVQYASNGTGNRALRFSTSDGGASADGCGAIRMPATSGARTVMAHTWPCQIDTDGTTIYMVGNQDSGGALNAYSPTIKVVALDGGGVYNS